MGLKSCETFYVMKIFLNIHFYYILSIVFTFFKKINHYYFICHDITSKPVYGISDIYSHHHFNIKYSKDSLYFKSHVFK